MVVRPEATAERTPAAAPTRRSATAVRRMQLRGAMAVARGADGSLQLEVPDALRGRVFATDMMIATLAISVSLLVFGALIDLVELRVLIAGCASATLLYAVGWRIATRRQVPSPPDPESGYAR